MQKDYFHIGEVEAQELMRLLLTHFNHAENISPWRYKYQKENSPYYLELSCYENGGIAEIVPSKNFPREELESIEKKIQNTIISIQDTRIDQVIGFCSEKIIGHFRYKDLFQILPIPKDAPESNMITADHPFILEVAYNASSDFTINQSRREKKAVVYSRLLNMLSNQPITLSPRYNKDAWVYVQKDTNNLTSEWQNLGYVYNGRKLNLKNFSDPENILPIEMIPFNTYYGSHRGRTSKPFKLPDNIELSLDKAFSLSTNKWRMFFMASSWYAQYLCLWRESNSSAFIALVTALECLIKEKEVCKHCNQPYIENVEICTRCNQPRYRITKHFQDFINHYFPSINEFPKEKKMIYHVRSQLAHGVDLLQADLEPWNFMMDARQHEQLTLQYNLYLIVGVAIYNWLHQA